MAARTGFTGRERGTKAQQTLNINGALIFTNAGVPSNGTTGANRAGIGSICIDTTNAEAYINAGTLASPTWKKITRAA